MNDRLIHPIFARSSHSTLHGGPSTAAIAILLVTLLVVALLLPSFGHLGGDSPDQPLRPPAGLGL